jgi:hypothetical protein
LYEGFWYQDEGYYASIGRAIMSGKTFYIDIWDHKPPLMFLIYGPLFTWLPKGFALVCIKLLNILCGIFTITLIDKILRHLEIKRDFRIIPLIMVVFALGMPLLEGNIFNMEVLFINISLLILYLLLLGKNHYLVGYLVFIDLLIKPQALFEAMGIVALFFLYNLYRKPVKEIVKVALGFIVPTLLFTFLLQYRGLLYEFINAVFLQNVTYSATYINSANILNVIFPNLLTKVVFLLFILGIAFVLLRRKHIMNTTAVIYSIAILEFIIAILSGREYPHYFIQTIPGFALALGIALNSQKIKYELNRFILMFLAFGFYLTVSTLGFNSINHILPVRYYTSFVQNNLLDEEEESVQIWKTSKNVKLDQEVADYINSHYSKEKTYYLYTANPWMFSFIDIPTTNKYVTWYHLMYGQKLYDEGMKGIKSADVLIIDWSTDEVLDEVKEYFNNEMVKVAIIGHFDVYKKKLT